MDNREYTSSFGSSNVECGNITDSLNTRINNIRNIGSFYTVNVNNVITDENLETMQWLSPLDPRGRHEDVRTNRVGGVGSWLFKTDEFRRWRSIEGGADEGVLFCYGDPGVGKTYLSSLVIDNLCDECGKEDIAVAMFYCDFRDQQQQTSTNMIGAILKQLAVRGDVLGHVRTAFQKVGNDVGGRSLLLPDMVRLLNQVIAELPQVFICIDALDECLSKNLLELLESLKGILHASSKTRIFVTGRPQVETEIKRFFGAGIIVPIIPKLDDIKRYLERRLEMDADPDAMSDGLRADILRIIPTRISEIFLLVSLNIDAILEAATISERREKLMEMTKGNHLGDGYATTLARIRAQKGSRPRLGMEALMWVSNSQRPLRTSELCHALGVKIGSTDLDGENVPTIRTLLACSLGLITVESSSDTVRLVHLTLQEYLSNNPSLFQSPHGVIAEVCLTYLNFQSVRELSPTLSSPPSTLALTEYATYYWEEHIRREKTESVSALALALLIGFEGHISAQLLLLRYIKGGYWWEWRLYMRDSATGFTGLHAAAFLGIGDALVGLLAMKEWDINATDGMGRTALAWAAVRGHEDIVKMLLQRKDVNPSTTDTIYGGTPIWLAARRGHSGIVRLLLERDDINPNSADTRFGKTPLRCATDGGHEGVVKLLLERDDINPNTSNTEYSQTPLCWAARCGHEGIVRLLLERDDIDPNTPDTRLGKTPLRCAAEDGHEGVVKLLLERDDINPNTADTKYGQTPLRCAAEGGHEGIVKLLLERDDINPNTADTKYGQTPLRCAAEGGHECIVKLLLERGDINPNTADTRFGRTPLRCASRTGHEGVVNLLLERDDINPNTADTKCGKTPLRCAAEDGHEGVVKLLLERDDINPSTADSESGQTPLWWAAGLGHERIVTLLLERGDINPNAADTKFGKTPLRCAAEGGHEGIVKLLLERDDINPNTADSKYGRTPVFSSLLYGYEGVAKLLLEREDVNPNITDTEYRRTSLSCAASGGHLGVLKLLLKREGTNPNTADTKYNRTPLWYAARYGHEVAVKLLLERADINPNTADTKYCFTPFLWAAAQGLGEAAKLLSERDGFNPNPAGTKFGLTPLLLAAHGGHGGVVKFLLDRGGIDPNTADTEVGRTPLSLASEGGYERVVELLLERDDTNPDIPDFTGKSPLDYAESRQHMRVVQLLSQHKPPLPIPTDTHEIPENPPPEPSDLSQSPSQPVPSTYPSVSQPLPPDARLPLGTPIFPLMVISSFIFLFYLLIVISPFPPTNLSPSFHR